MLALAFGCYFGYMMKGHEIPRAAVVTRALYVACANSRSFDPTEHQPGTCNRLAIDSLLATVYGGVAAAPSPDPASIAHYEAPLVDLRPGAAR
jgi:hypothetical protein